MRRRNRLGLAVAILGLCLVPAAIWNARAQEEAERWILQPAGDPIKITKGAHTLNPSWSPDAAEIAYIKARKTEMGWISSLNVVSAAEDAIPQTLAELPPDEHWSMLPEYGARWSPDGRYLLFMLSPRREQLAPPSGLAWVLEREGAEMIKPSGDDVWTEPIWVGKSGIAFSKPRFWLHGAGVALEVYDIASQEARTLVSDEEGERIRALCTSADGREVLAGWSRREPDGEGEADGAPNATETSHPFTLAAVDLEDGSVRKLLTLPRGEWVRSAERLGSTEHYVLWKVSANPRLLSVRVEEDRAVEESSVMRVDKGRTTQLTERDRALFPSASPDGKWVAYIKHIPLRNDDDQTKGMAASLWAVDSQGAAPQQLIAEHVDPYSKPSWSPKGDAIAFTWEGDVYVQRVRSAEYRPSPLENLPTAQKAYAEGVQSDLVKIGEAIELYRKDWEDYYPPSQADAKRGLNWYVRSSAVLDWLDVAEINLPQVGTAHSDIDDPSSCVLMEIHGLS